MSIRNRIAAVVAALLLPACAHLQPPGEPFAYAVDPSVQPSRPTLPGLDGEPPRDVGVIVGPDERRDEFVVDEVVFRPRNESELEAFLNRYQGVILRDGRPLLLPGSAMAEPPASGWYLIRIDPTRSPLTDLAANMEAGGSRGQFLFSSEHAARPRETGRFAARAQFPVATERGPRAP